MQDAERPSAADLKSKKWIMERFEEIHPFTHPSDSCNPGCCACFRRCRARMAFFWGSYFSLYPPLPASFGLAGLTADPPSLPLQVPGAANPFLLPS